MAAISDPANLEDVVALIHRLYRPGSPEEHARIQDALQKVQRSSDGWQVADSLLESPDQHVRFFGALTFTVKLNSDGESLLEDDVPVLRNRLIGWLVKLVNEGLPKLIAKKLCSTLAVFFIRFPESWTDCIRHLLCCLAAGHVKEFVDFPPLAVLLRSVSPDAKLATLWFAAILVEEVGKIDTKNIKNHHYHIKIQCNAEAVVELIRNVIDMPYGLGVIPENFDERIVDAGLTTFQAWVFYSIRAFIGFQGELPQLKSLTPIAINWLASEDVFDTTCDVIIDILAQSFSFFTPEDSLSLARILTSPWAVTRYELLVSGDSEWGSIQFSRLLVTFAEVTVQKLAKSFDTPHGRAMIEMLHGMLTLPGYPQVDDEISGTTFEFWGSLVDFVVDIESLDNVSHEPWVVDCKKELRRAVEEFWRKIRIPPVDESAGWSKDQRDGFMSFRKDAADFIEAAYGVLGSGIFEQFADQVTGALDSSVSIPWREVEASLFCLNALTDSLGDEPHEDMYLERLFGSDLFVMLADISIQTPLRARTTSVNLIGCFASFFERHPRFLPPALNFLFTCISASTLARNASKSVAALCSSCRTTLTSELNAFLQQYSIFAADPAADDITKERVLCAIAYVVQALPSDNQKLEPLVKLLGYVETDVHTCFALIRQQRQEEAKELGVLVLRCLVAIGKGLQAQDDLPIDLNAAEEPLAATSFWIGGEGALLQGKIVGLIRTLCAALSGDGEVIDTACAVFRTGFTETLPGLFVFAPTVVTEFLLEYSARTETVLATASTLISSHSISGSADISVQVHQLLVRVVEIVTGLGDPQRDPEIAQSVVEFLGRLLRCYVNVLVFYQPYDRLENLFMFALDSLVVREPLVKKAASGFWASFLSLANLDESAQRAVEEITQGCGPRLVERLCWGLGGGCQRSEVDTLTEPLRKLVTRSVRCKTWLTEALRPSGFPTQNTSDTDKKLFVEKVMSLRGKRGTNQVAKEFWLKARGTEFAYVS